MGAHCVLWVQFNTAALQTLYVWRRLHAGIIHKVPVYEHRVRGRHGLHAQDFLNDASMEPLPCRQSLLSL